MRRDDEGLTKDQIKVKTTREERGEKREERGEGFSPIYIYITYRKQLSKDRMNLS